MLHVQPMVLLRVRGSMHERLHTAVSSIDRQADVPAEAFRSLSYVVFPVLPRAAYLQYMLIHVADYLEMTPRCLRTVRLGTVLTAPKGRGPVAEVTIHRRDKTYTIDSAHVVRAGPGAGRAGELAWLLVVREGISYARGHACTGRPIMRVVTHMVPCCFVHWHRASCANARPAGRLVTRTPATWLSLVPRLTLLPLAPPQLLDDLLYDHLLCLTGSKEIASTKVRGIVTVRLCLYRAAVKAAQICTRAAGEHACKCRCRELQQRAGLAPMHRY